MNTRRRCLSLWVFIFFLVHQAHCKYSGSKRIAKGNTTKFKSPIASNSITQGDDYVISSDNTELEYADINSAGGTGDYVIVDEENTVYVTEVEDGTTTNIDATNEIYYETDDNYVTEIIEDDDGTHVVTVIHGDDDSPSDGREVIIVDGTEIPLDSDGSDDVIVVVDGDYDYDSGNGDGDTGQEIVVIIDEPTSETTTQSPVVIIVDGDTETTTQEVIDYPTDEETTTTTTTVPTTTSTTTMYTVPPTLPSTTPTMATTTTTVAATTTTTVAATTTTTVPTTTVTTTSTYSTGLTTSVPINSSCNCNIVINNNNYNYYNGRNGIPVRQNTGRKGGGKIHYHVIQKPSTKGTVPRGGRKVRRIIRKIGNKQRMANNGNGIRRRYLTRNMVTKNLGTATGTGNVQVYRVLKTGKQGKRVLVKNLRKRAQPVFRIGNPVNKPLGMRTRKNDTISWKVVPKWKAQRMQKLGLNTKIGKLEQRRIVNPNNRQKGMKNRTVNTGKRLRFNNNVMNMNKKTKNTYDLAPLNLGLQKRLLKRRVSKKFVQKKP